MAKNNKPASIGSISLWPCMHSSSFTGELLLIVVNYTSRTLRYVTYGNGMLKTSLGILQFYQLQRIPTKDKNGAPLISEVSLIIITGKTDTETVP